VKFTASKRRARYLDPKARLVTEPIDPDHLDWGIRFVVLGTDDERIACAGTAASVWKAASRNLDRAREEMDGG